METSPVSPGGHRRQTSPVSPSSARAASKTNGEAAAAPEAAAQVAPGAAADITAEDARLTAQRVSVCSSRSAASSQASLGWSDSVTSWERSAQEWLPSVRTGMNDLRRRSRNCDPREVAMMRRASLNQSGMSFDRRMSSPMARTTVRAALQGDMLRIEADDSYGSSERRADQRRRSSVGSGGYRRRLQSMGATQSDRRSAASGVQPRARKREFLKQFLGALRTIVNSKTFNLLAFSLTIYVLFGEDLRLSFFYKTEDSIFDAITFVALFFFTFELISMSLVVDDYFLSFFFILDVVSTFSLILDLTFIWENLINEADDGEGSSEAGIARAGRSSRAGTRVVRILRVVKLVRMVRIVKFIQFDMSKSRKDSADLAMSEEGEPNTAKESRVGKKLSERTTLWVITLVLAMLLIIPQLNIEDEEEMMESSAQYGANVVYQAWHDAMQMPMDIARRTAFELQLLMYIYYHNYHAACPQFAHASSQCASQAMTKLCYVGYITEPGSSAEDSRLYDQLAISNVNGSEWDRLFATADNPAEMFYIVGNIPSDIKARLEKPWVSGCPSSTGTAYGVSFIGDDACPWASSRFRPSETSRYVPEFYKERHKYGQFFFVFDKSDFAQKSSLMSIARGAFIIFTLIVASIVFSRDTDNLVLLPIERMIKKVEIIQRQPLEATNLALFIDKERTTRRSLWALLVEVISGRPYKAAREVNRRSRNAKRVMLETKTLENTILKLGSLLALGFGEAGTAIIGKNLGASTGVVNAIIPGQEVEAIYGVCNIQDFAFTTVCLQEKTMVFVNQVAEIVHRIVDAHLGSPNKNIGETFLLVWRLGNYDAADQRRIADLSVMSFVQVVGAVHRDYNLSVYREHPALLGRKREYRVNVHFGLHMGRAIEGAIGSEFKIDASYISSDVNFAMQLEGITKAYDVTLIMSESLVWAGSEKLASNYRVIDNVKMPGMKTNTRIFTVDLDVYALEVDEPRKPCELDQAARKTQRDEERRRKLKRGYRVDKIFATDPHIVAMREAYSLKFFQDFEKGYLNYESGEWGVAAEMFRGTLNMVRGGRDGPSATLLEQIAESGNRAPADWPGFRHLRHEHSPNMVGRRRSRG